MRNTHIERFAVFSDVAPGHTVMVPLETTMPEKATSCGVEKTEIAPVIKKVYLNIGNGLGECFKFQILIMLYK